MSDPGALCGIHHVHGGRISPENAKPQQTGLRSFSRQNELDLLVRVDGYVPASLPNPLAQRLLPQTPKPIVNLSKSIPMELSGTGGAREPGQQQFDRA
ncbi:hypothetical protein [Sandarakinorhabdus sp.]|uniref:hypothetical protein n=1 Tax=Sandarakinorhabdus sp. TaxID=1916663 RepID=UPI003568AE17